MLQDKYLKKMKDLLKDEYDAYLNSFNDSPYKGLRVNTSKISINDFLKIFPYNLTKIPWTSDGFYYTDESITKHPFYYAGLYYIQEPSAMLPGELLPIEENDLVLDACAAPGGKSLKLLNKLNGSGLLVTNDISSSRMYATLRNVERWGQENCFVSANDINDLKDKFKNTFDKILLDAPCSGEGMFRKDPSLIKSWLLKDSEYYVPIQKELIISCLEMLKDGGILLYSTCTFDKKEDEEIIEYAFSKYNNLKLLDIAMYDGFTKGNNNIGVKLFPHKVKGEGHFACLIKKGNKKEKNENNKNKSDIDIPFFKEYINKEYQNGQVKIINDSIYYVPIFNTNNIHILRSGLLLGKYKNDNFMPSQALAMSLKKDEFKNILNLKLDDEDVFRYLKGETLKNRNNQEGYILICVEGFPLGFGKAQNDIIKNKIDKGWIIR